MTDRTRPMPSDGDPDDEPTRRIEDGSFDEAGVGRAGAAGRPDGGGHRGGGGDEPDEGGWRRFGGRNMPVAIASGLLLAVLLIGTVLWHPAAFTTLVLVIVLVGVAETGRVLREHGEAVAVPVVLVATLVTVVGTYRAAGAGQVVGVGVLLVGAIVWELVDTDREDVLRRIAGTTMLGLWIPFLASYAVLLVLLGEGWVAVIAVAGVAVISDVGAFVVGIRFGRRKLAPTISPAKTVEGVVGGLVLAMVVAAIILPFLGTGEMFSPASAMIFAVSVGIAGAVGDLAESMLKRDVGVKDFGGILPGHGGIFDRVDSVLFALPTGYYVLALLG